MDLGDIWTTVDLAHRARCAERTVERWLKASHHQVANADALFARKLPGTGGWLINGTHPNVVSFLATPRKRGRPASKHASSKEGAQ